MMRILEWIILLLIPAWVVAYTVNFARYLWKDKYVSAAISSLVLAGLGGVGAVVFFYFQVFGG
jgi:hypothetical protein